MSLPELPDTGSADALLLLLVEDELPEQATNKHTEKAIEEKKESCFIKMCLVIVLLICKGQ